MRSLALVPLALAACLAGLPEPTSADAARAHVPLAALVRGHRLYVDKCSSCHAPFPPSHLPATAWPHQVDEMAKPAHLTGAERDAIVAYLQALAPENSALLR
jgi:mono/diheme cytochrome c family protein